MLIFFFFHIYPKLKASAGKMHIYDSFDFNILLGPQSKLETSVFNPQNLCSVFIVCFESPHCCLLQCFIMST